jgi:hypothetical protein
MGALWWELPGPRRFIQRVVQALRDGKNIVIGVPEYGPDDIPNALQHALNEDGDWYWQRVDAANHADELPAHVLMERFVGDPPPGELWNANLLAQQASFAGKVVWVSNVTAEAWPRWREFITDYAHACRSRPSYARGLCVIPLFGTLAGENVTPEICLSVHLWRGCVDWLDMMLYTANITPLNGLTRTQGDTALATISHLALWDRHVAEVLANESLESLFNPGAILRRIAVERGWNKLHSKAYTWHQGIVDVVDAQGEKTHSAILALNDTNGELDGRIWSAQVGVIFPLIEEHRRRLLRQLGKRLRTPFTTRFGGVIKEVWDLELGHIAAQVKEYSIPLSKTDRQLLDQLVRIRNSLSHLEVLEPDLLRL